MPETKLQSQAVKNGSIIADKLGLSPQTSYVSTDQSTTSNSYTDLATAQSVTITVGANGLALAIWSSGIYTSATAKRVSIAVSGATTVSADDAWSLRCDTASFSTTQSTTHLFTGLTAGTNTFTLKFKSSGSATANFFERRLTVIPL